MANVKQFTAALRNLSSASGSSSLNESQSSARSMFGAAGGPGCRLSLSSLLEKINSVQSQNTGVISLNLVDNATMQGLNSRLATYLSRVRQLEESNSELENHIKEILVKRGSINERDWSVYEEPLANLRKQIRDLAMDNARLELQINSATLAIDDFRVRTKSEESMRQILEQDIAGLCKMTEETKLNSLQLKGQNESLKEELEFLKKNHKEEVATLCKQISDSSVVVEMAAPQGPNINETIQKIRQQYEQVSQKNLEDTETWYQKKFENLTTEVTQNTEELEAGKKELKELHKQKQTLENELHTVRNMNRSLEDTLLGLQHRSSRDMHAFNQSILQLEAELDQARAHLERQAADYQALLNTKVKLESEIADYRRLLEGLPINESAAAVYS